jgi:photosystem II stability/assembly factor-like uncharacterized protein
MRRDTAFRQFDPVDLSEIERVASHPVFDDLRLEIMARPPQKPKSVDREMNELRLHGSTRSWRPVAAIIVLLAVVVVAGLIAFGGGGTPQGKSGHVRNGTWKLMDDPLSGTWQQNTTGGPPPGALGCPSTSTCYTMSGQYPSPAFGTKPTSESLYVSTDVGASWKALPMPQGFVPTSPLACGGASDCAAGGTYNGQSVLVTTTDGGQSFAINPLPAGVGHLDTLSCPSTEFCAGLAADSEYLDLTPSDASFLATSDGGKTFTDMPIIAGDSMEALTCSSSSDCTTVGWNDVVGEKDLTAGVTAKTTDGGQTWTAGTLPSGFGINPNSELSCADTLHCSVSGSIAATVQNPLPCTTGNQPPSSQGNSGYFPTDPQSPAVLAISEAEAATAANAILKLGTSGGEFSCSNPPIPTGRLFIDDIATTTDGGLNWAPDALPTNVPEPHITDLSCPTDNQCWAAGSQAVSQQVGTSHNSDSSVLLGTTDAGSTWSTVTFSAPTGVPNEEQAYFSMGGIACASSAVCVALGTGNQGTPSVPTYSLVVPGSN